MDPKEEQNIEQASAEQVADEAKKPPEIIDLIEMEGLSRSEAEVLLVTAEKATDDLSEKKAVFPLREWDKAFAAVADPEWIANPKWGAIRRLVLKHAGVVGLSKTGMAEAWSLYSTEKTMALEEEMISLAKRQTEDHPVPSHLMDEAFASRPSMAEEQKNAVVVSCTGNSAVVVTEGTAGAGKSFTLNAVREIYERVPGRTPEEAVGYDIIGTALSWTATKVLEASAGLSGGRAIEGLVRAMEQAREKGGDFFKRRTILIVDEAGLVGSAHMHKILYYSATSKHPVKVILTGDSLQLNPVMAGNSLEAIVDECGSARLDTIRRQKQDSHRRAVKHFCFGRAENGLWTYWQQEAIKFCENKEDRLAKVMRDYVRYMVDNPGKNALILALENKEVATLNLEIRAMLKKIGRLRGEEVTVNCYDGKSVFEAGFSPGDQVVLRKNNVKHPVYKSLFKTYSDGCVAVNKACEQSSLTRKNFADAMAQPFKTQIDRHGVFNRTAGTVLGVRKHPSVQGAALLRILLSEGGEIEIDTSEYKDKETGACPLTHNFATTIYASQGQTVERVFILDSRFMNRRLAYVGMSRHTELCDIYVDRQDVATRRSEEVARRRAAATKAFEKASKAGGQAFETARTALKETLAQWPEKPAEEMAESDLLQTMAVCWNQDSTNPTAWMAKKHMNERKAKVDKEGGDAWRPKKHKDDDPEDNPEKRHRRPPAFETIQMTAAERMLDGSDFSRDAYGNASAAMKSRTEKLASENTDISWSDDPLVAGALGQLKGKFWDENRFGEKRFFSMDPVDGHAVSRWTLYGKRVCGDGEMPVLPNSDHFSKAPWLVVPGFREALTAWSHYRSTRGHCPEKIPNIAVAIQGADFKSLYRWVGSRRPKMVCVWSKNDPAGPARVAAIANRLRQCGFAAEAYDPPTSARPSGEKGP